MSIPPQESVLVKFKTSRGGWKHATLTAEPHSLGGQVHTYLTRDRMTWHSIRFTRSEWQDQQFAWASLARSGVKKRT
ncbi:MAG: hypothetical protein AAB937_00540 [Patescibacteria group bacterium]